MITITIVRDVEKAIIRFSVSGHALYDDPGKDIVCAGVSAVTIGAVNAIEKLTGLEPRAISKSGLLQAEAPRSTDPIRNDQVQLLLEGMVAALESIVETYGKFVKIKETFEKKGG
ncbi:ribosomal-processing cysteine protease Prp [Cohnella endophytica]|uniref:Ribosomal processing cysteine protease Prp n=1 Tax=Cohnella endophytica TaxID=2419778 RepID=A0A494Y1N2_9BACL|nr:ribosomal-processing cysteine protease Prp [Cohnella endophytica]RKP54252.1 ribosomal-processing cysteine protease Prp [Cohnella endophytica]